MKHARPRVLVPDPLPPRLPLPSHRARASRPDAQSVWRALAAPLVALGAFTACGGHLDVHAHPAPPPPPPPVVWDEGEPNDAAWLAPWFGSLVPGETIRVSGFASDDGSDPQDGLAFTGYGPCRIDFHLAVEDPWTDLDVWLYDADFGVFVDAFTVAYGSETGTFWLDGVTNFHLVVVPSWGASWWDLEVAASSTYYGGLASATLPPLPDALSRYADAPSDDELAGRGGLDASDARDAGRAPLRAAPRARVDRIAPPLASKVEETTDEPSGG